MAFTQNSCNLGNTTPTYNTTEDLGNVISDAYTMNLEDFTEAFRRWCIEKNVKERTLIFNSDEGPRYGLDFKENDDGILELVKSSEVAAMNVGEFLYHLDKMCAEGFADARILQNYEIKKIDTVILIGYDMNHDSYQSSRENCIVVIK